MEVQVCVISALPAPAPVTVTFWLTFQFVGLKVRSPLTVATRSLPLTGVTVTSWVGLLLSLTL